MKTNGNPGKNGAGKAVVAAVSQKMTRAPVGGRIWLGLGLLLALLAMAALVYTSQEAGQELQQATRGVTQTREVLGNLAEISTSLAEVESAARSFALSGKQSHLNPFHTAAKAVPEKLEELKVLVGADPEALREVVEVEPEIGRHLRVMRDMVEAGQVGFLRGSSQKKLTDEGNTLMEAIRKVFGKLEARERSKLKDQQANLAARADRVTLIGLAGSVLAGLLVLVFGLLGFRALCGQVKTQGKLDRFLGSMPDALVIVNAEGRIISSNAHTEKLFGYTERELQGESMALLVPERVRQNQRQYYAGFFMQRGDRVQESTIELCGLRKDGEEFPIEISTRPLMAEKGLVVTSAIRDISGRKRVEQQISELNQELRDRAAELETANRELEAFSYSVSHDLRSPLQNIDSFSQILMEEYANRLDADGRDYVQRLRGSCQHMEEIIEALLALSNMTRHELALEQVDLGALAKAIGAELKQKDPDRLVDWVIADGLTVQGDAKLLRVVLENLLGNAWKFTSKRPRARIEFGALPQCNGARTYFVRDDGAGFDMMRARQLFTPFKRLHDQSQFRGTGIGLATVQRVIERHRGRIWAEGLVDQGATFCFTLGNQTTATNGRTPELVEHN